MTLALDHIVYAVPDVDRAVAEFAEATGIQAAVGGVHAGQGTKNCLLALVFADGSVPPRTAYFEFIGPDPDQPGVAPEDTMFGIGLLGAQFSPRIHTWAIRPADLDNAAASARARGVEVGESRSSSRVTPSGTFLSWRVTARLPLPLHGIQPFLIDWGRSPHPAAQEIPSLTVRDMHAEYVEPTELEAAFAALDVEVAVRPGEAPALVLTVDTPRGPLELR